MKVMKIILNRPQKNITSKIKRNLNNTTLKKHFDENCSKNIWYKDIFTGE